MPPFTDKPQRPLHFHQGTPGFDSGCVNCGQHVTDWRVRSCDRDGEEATKYRTERHAAFVGRVAGNSRA